MKILIADDNPDYRRLLCDTFRDRGWEAVAAADGAAGLALMREQAPDVVLSDILMPHMDGFTFLKEVRKSEFREIIFIFYTSAYTEKSQEEFAFSLGVDAYIVKPLDPEEIFSTLQELLEGTKQRPATCEFPSEEEFLRKHNIILSQKLVEKVCELQKEKEERRKAEEELERLKRKMQGRLLESDFSAAPCPFAVSEDVYRPIENIAAIVRGLRKRQEILDKPEAVEAVERISSLAVKMKVLLQDLLRFTLLSRQEVLTPSRMILALVESVAASAGEDLEPLRPELDAIKAEIRTCTGYVEDLLRAAAAYSSPVKKTWVNLSEMAGEIECDLRRAAPERAVEFMIRENMTALADAPMMRLALRELLDNAWKFSMKTESAKIEFGTTTIRNDNVFFVRDNGAGFDMKCADALFIAFRRLHPKDDFPGNGIGLMIVKGVVSRHGGTVWAVGEPGAGATFYFTLYRM